MVDRAVAPPGGRAPAEPRNALADAIRDLSAGNVVDIPPSGPVLRGRRRPHRGEVRRDTYAPSLSTRDRVVMALLSSAWLGFTVAFWVWWFQPAHRVSWTGLILNSAVLLYLSTLPIFFVIAANRLRQVDPRIPVPQLRVAFVVTRAPSEPWPIARTTLAAMLTQDFPYEYHVWLCDEDPSAEIEDWCRRNNVRISTRRGVPGYHRAEWPRRTRCKEGNLAYFYDRWGYADYDVVAQLDCDHVPEPGYLTEVVRPFADPAIGYVAAPSVCDANAANSWSARSRLYRESTFHGPFQAGHADGLAPLCIGSHYAVRTSALRDIGGLGPELAEDFSTSFLLTSAGWHGAFALNAHASGDGPPTFAAMLTQEFQWSRSLATVLYGLVPGHLKRLSWLLRVRFMYALMYYPLLVVTTVVGLALPPIAAVTGLLWIEVNYFEFLLRWAAASACLLLMFALLRRRGVLRPRTAPILSWELWLGAVTRWPFVAWGVFAATLQTFRPRPVGFKVTPKGAHGLEPLPVRLVLPFAVVTAVMSAAALLGELNTRAAGYVFLCLLAAVAYSVVAISVCVLHAVEAARATATGVATALRATVRVPLLVGAAPIPLLLLTLALYPPYAIRAFGW